MACDVRIRRADGSLAIDAKGVSCLDGSTEAPPGRITLALPQIVFEGEDSDPLGHWIIDVTLMDRHRPVTLPLRRLVTLEPRKGSGSVGGGTPALNAAPASTESHE